jgi:hypothetical protein
MVLKERKMTNLDILVNQAVTYADKSAPGGWLAYSKSQRDRAISTGNFSGYTIWDAAFEKIKLLDIILPPAVTLH